MPTKIRLQRRGKKGRPFFHIVIADSHAPRDGKFVERIGTYNPLLMPAGIELDFERAMYWYQSGAQPTETVRALLSYKGILYKAHLLNGVKKGALTAEQVEEKFNLWISEKNSKIAEKANAYRQNRQNQSRKRYESEVKVSEERAQAIAKQRAKANLKIEEEPKPEAPEAQPENPPAEA